MWTHSSRGTRGGRFTPPERSRAIKLLEMQRHALLMYTSCGWFFDEISGTEAVQVLMYAGRVIQLAEELCDAELEAGVPRATGPRTEQSASPSRERSRGLREVRVGRPGSPGRTSPHTTPSPRCFSPSPRRHASLATTWFSKTSSFTRPERSSWSSATRGLIRRSRSSRGTSCMRRSISGTTTSTPGSLPIPVTRLMRRRPRSWPRPFPAWTRRRSFASWTAAFGEAGYSIASLFRDLQRQVLKRLLRAGLTEITEMYQHVFDRNLPLMRFLKHLAAPIPMPLQATAAGAFQLRPALGPQGRRSGPGADSPAGSKRRRPGTSRSTAGRSAFSSRRCSTAWPCGGRQSAEAARTARRARGQPRRGARASVRAQPLDAAERLLRRARTSIRRDDRKGRERPIACRRGGTQHLQFVQTTSLLMSTRAA